MSVAKVIELTGLADPTVAGELQEQFAASDRWVLLAQEQTPTTNRIVASIMTETVVEVLKAVDVDHQEAESMTVSFHAGHLALELSFKASTVCETSQMVRKSRFFTRVEVGFELE